MNFCFRLSLTTYDMNGSIWVEFLTMSSAPDTMTALLR